MGTVCFELNGEKVNIKNESPQRTLLSWLRNSGRTGTKEGCAEGECGACAVALLSRDAAGRAHYQSVNSCLLPLGAVHGRSVLSVEGLSPEACPKPCSERPSESLQGFRLPLHPVQSALAEAGGSQCGYCTPGFVVSLFCEYYRPGRRQYDSEAISGNLCRCTGYRPIVDTAKGFPVPPPQDRFSLQLLTGPGSLPELQYTAKSQRYLRPKSLQSLLQTLETEPQVQLISGGTDLMVAANLRAKIYPSLVDGACVDELQVFCREEDALVLGAGLTLTQLQQQLALDPISSSQNSTRNSALLQMLPLFASRLIRNRATLGGNLVTASPIGDLAPVLLALNATLVLADSQGTTLIALHQFGRGFRKTKLAAGQLLLQIRIPQPEAEYQRFYKVSRRPLDDISTVSAAFALNLDEQRRVTGLTIAYGAIADRALVVPDLQSLAVGRLWDRQLLSVLVAHGESLGTPLSDHRGSAQYRRAMIGRLMERFYEDIWDEISGETGAAVKAPEVTR